MTDKEQVMDAVKRWNFLVCNKEDPESEYWFDSIPITIRGDLKQVVRDLLNWLPEAHMNDHTSGFIIQNRAVFNKWYEQLKLNTNDDMSTTNSSPECEF